MKITCQRVCSPLTIAAIALLTAFGATRAARGEQAVVIVPRAAPAHDIPLSSLAPAAGGPWQIASWVPTSRGELIAVADGLRYLPGPAFRDKGSDSFRCWLESAAESLLVEVFLVADLGPGDDDPGFGETTAGGNTVLVLDLGLPPRSDFEPLLLATGRDGATGVGFELWLAETGAGLGFEVTALAYTHGGVEAAPPVALGYGQHTIVLDWWLAGRVNAGNGGLLLRRGTTLAASLAGLDNHLGAPLAWTFPAWQAEGSPVVEAPSHFPRTAGLPMPFPPLFADTFEAGVAAGWQTTTGSPGALPGFTVGPQAAADGAAGLVVDLSSPAATTALIDTSPSALRRYRARFELGLAGGCGGFDASAHGALTLLDGWSGDRPGPVFQLRLLPSIGGIFQLLVTASVDDGAVLTSLATGVLHQGATLDLEWWAASAPSVADGGVQLRVDGASLPVLELTLDNTGWRLDGVRFGVVENLGVGQATVCLDELESWR